MREHESLGGRATPGLLQQLHRDPLTHLTEPHKDRGVWPVMVRQVERSGVRLQKNIPIGEVQLDRHRLAILFQPGQEPLAHVQGRSAKAGTLVCAGQACGVGAQLPPGDAARPSGWSGHDRFGGSLLNGDARRQGLLLQHLVLTDGLRRVAAKSRAMTDGPRMPQLTRFQIGTLRVGGGRN